MSSLFFLLSILHHFYHCTNSHALEGRTDPDAKAVRGYCLAVRSAITDDGKPPLEADGLKLQERLQAIDDSILRVAEKRGSPMS